MNRKSGGLWLFCAAYFITYLVRNSYSSVLVEIIRDLNVTKQTASIALTGSFFTYGLGQFISGRLGDRFQPHRIILTGLVSTAAINVSIALIPNIHFMNIIWISSGFFHSMIWSPLVRMVNHAYPENKQFSHVIGRVNQGSYIGTVVIYFLAALYVAKLHWRLLFLTTGAISLIFSGIWFYSTRGLTFTATLVPVHKDTAEGDCPEENKPTVERLTLGTLLRIGFLPILLSTLGIGFLRDGIATWMPVYFTEVFHMDASLSILTSIVLPLCAVAMVEVIAKVKDRLKNDIKCAMLTFLLATGFALILVVFQAHWMLLDLAMMAGLTFCLRGSSFMLTSYVPHYFHRYGKVSTVSGLINGFIYIGSAIATYTLALLTDNFGWRINISIWMIIAALCTGLCFVATGPWGRFVAETTRKK
ncbi:MAG: MFS transporter [Firmicutes bacterium]|nr:MFS transporter [Bacillota bacterium]